MGFLEQFGYLGDGNSESEALYREEAVAEAISAMQRFGGIQVSGKIDAQTLKVKL